MEKSKVYFTDFRAKPGYNLLQKLERVIKKAGIEKIDFEKMGGLVPAIIQDSRTSKVLMLGFMNEPAWEKTQETGKVTFFSRTKNRLWTKGETSGNFLYVESVKVDCDNDTLLIEVRPVGPVCHTGSDTCFDEVNREDLLLLKSLQKQVDSDEKPEAPVVVENIQRQVSELASTEQPVATAAEIVVSLQRLLSLSGYGIDDIAAEIKKRYNL